MAVVAAQGSVGAADLLRRRCDQVVTAEVDRLSRRVPGLSSAQLGQVEATVARIVQELVLARARMVREGQLAALFGLTQASPTARSRPDGRSRPGMRR